MAGRIALALGVAISLITAPVMSLRAQDTAATPSASPAKDGKTAGVAQIPDLPLCRDDSGLGGAEFAVNGTTHKSKGVEYWKKWVTPPFTRGPVSDPLHVVIDMTEPKCVAQPVPISTPNKQAIEIDIKVPDTGDCSVTPTETIVPVTAQDIGAIIAKFLGGLPTVFGVAEEAITAESGAEATGAIHLHPVSNAKATVTLSCKKTDGTTKTTKTVVITYQNMPPVSASAGAIVSLLGKKTYGVNTTIGSVSASGAVTPVYTVGVTSTSTIQLVPVAFLNTYLIGNRNSHFDLQTGLGINPNGSKTNVEYFVGPALAWHGVYFSPGMHIAQAEYLTSGFAVGQTVSSGSFTVPTVWKTTLKFGFSITYSPKVTSTPTAGSTPGPAAN
jgi:hypothetical protein